MLTIYGRATSSNVQLVMWAVGELELPHERLDYGHVHGGLDAPDYLALNPHGKVPTLVDGDTVIWESMAILRYLAARYGDGGGVLASRSGGAGGGRQMGRMGQERAVAGLYRADFLVAGAHRGGGSG